MEHRTFSQRYTADTPPKMREGSPSRENPAETERTNALETFRTRQPDQALAEVAAKRESAQHPERLLWEAAELMMRDEVWRDRWLRELVTGKPEKDPAETFAEYQKIVAKYRTLVELADKSDDRSLGQKEIIPHFRLGDLRTRLADLLANQSFYFPDRSASSQDLHEAFTRLSETYYAQQQEGRAAEVALIGLLRYGPEWLRGGAKANQHLQPALHVERTLPREDILASRKSLQAAGQFKGYDLIYRVPQETRVRFVQVKTGAMEHKAFHANLPAPLLTRAWQQLLGSATLRRAVPDAPGLAEGQMYREAIEAITGALPLEGSARDQLKKVLLPAKRAAPREAEPTVSYSVSLRGVEDLLKKTAFKKFALEHDMPLVAHAGNFQQWTDFLRKARANYPNEPFWKKASSTKNKPRTGSQNALNI